MEKKELDTKFVKKYDIVKLDTHLGFNFKNIDSFLVDFFVNIRDYFYAGVSPEIGSIFHDETMSFLYFVERDSVPHLKLLHLCGTMTIFWVVSLILTFIGAFGIERGIVKGKEEFREKSTKIIKEIYSLEKEYILNEVDYSLNDINGLFRTHFPKLYTMKELGFDAISKGIGKLILSFIYSVETKNGKENFRVLSRQELYFFFSYCDPKYFIGSNSTKFPEYFFRTEEISGSSFIFLEPSYNLRYSKLGFSMLGGLYTNIYMIFSLCPSISYRIFFSLLVVARSSSTSNNFTTLTNASIMCKCLEFGTFIQGVTLVGPTDKSIRGAFGSAETYVMSSFETGLKSGHFDPFFLNHEDLNTSYVDIVSSIRDFYFNPEVSPVCGGSTGTYINKMEGMFPFKAYLKDYHRGIGNQAIKVIITLYFRHYGHSDYCYKLVRITKYPPFKFYGIRWITGHHVYTKGCICLTEGVCKENCQGLVNKYFFLDKKGRIHGIKKPYIIPMLPGTSIPRESLPLFLLPNIFNPFSSHYENVILPPSLREFSPELYRYQRGYKFLKENYEKVFEDSAYYYDANIKNCYCVLKSMKTSTKNLMFMFISRYFKSDLIKFFEFLNFNFYLVEFFGDFCERLDFFDLVSLYFKTRKDLGKEDSNKKLVEEFKDIGCFNSNSYSIPKIPIPEEFEEESTLEKELIALKMRGFSQTLLNYYEEDPDYRKEIKFWDEFNLEDYLNSPYKKIEKDKDGRITYHIKEYCEAIGLYAEGEQDLEPKVKIVDPEENDVFLESYDFISDLDSYKFHQLEKMVFALIYSKVFNPNAKAGVGPADILKKLTTIEKLTEGERISYLSGNDICSPGEKLVYRNGIIYKKPVLSAYGKYSLYSTFITLKLLRGWDLFSKRPVLRCIFVYDKNLVRILYSSRVLKAMKNPIKN